MWVRDQGQVASPYFFGKVMQPCGWEHAKSCTRPVSYGSLETQDYEGIGQEGIMVCRNLGSRERFSASLIFSTPEDIEHVETQLDFLCSWITGHHQHPSIICTMFTSTICMVLFWEFGGETFDFMSPRLVKQLNGCSTNLRQSSHLDYHQNWKNHGLSGAPPVPLQDFHLGHAVSPTPCFSPQHGFSFRGFQPIQPVT